MAEDSRRTGPTEKSGLLAHRSGPEGGSRATLPGGGIDVKAREGADDDDDDDDVPAIRSQLSEKNWIKASPLPEGTVGGPILTPEMRRIFSEQQESKELAIKLACYYIDMGLRDLPTFLHGTDEWGEWCFTVRRNKWYRLFVRINIVLQMALVLIEPPSFRAAEDDPTQNAIELAVGSVSVCIQMADVVMRAYPFGWSHFHFMANSSGSKAWNSINAVVVGINALDVLSHMFTMSTFRFSRAFRPLLLIAQSKTLRRSVAIVAASFIPVAGVMLVFFVAVFCFSYLGVVFFRGLYHYGPDEIPAGDFDHLASSMLSHFVLITTENYPFIIFPAFEVSKWSCIHFILFCFLHLLFTALLLGVVYDSYKEQHTATIIRTLVKEKRNFLLAFEILDFDRNGTLDSEEWAALLAVLRPELTTTQVHLLFNLLDKDKSGSVDGVEFCMLADMLKWTFEPVGPDVFQRTFNRITPHLPGEGWGLRRMRESVHSTAFMYMMKGLVLINTFTLFVYTEATTEDKRLIVLQCVFMGFFSFEMAARIVGFGWYAYWASMWDRVDCLLTCTSLVFMALYFADIVPDLYNMTVFRAFDLFRLKAPVKGTIGRLLFLDQRISNFVHAVRQSVYLLVSIGSIIVFIMYTWSIIGMELFEGALDSLPAGQYDIPQSNFDSWPYAMLCLFQIFMVNNWNDVMYAYIKGTGNPHSSWYFTTLYILLSTVMLDLFIGLTIECFTREYENAGREGEVFEYTDSQTKSDMRIRRPRRWSRELVKDDISELYDDINTSLHTQAAASLQANISTVQRGYGVSLNG